MNAAQQLIATLEGNKDRTAVKIDHLAFSFKLSELRHLCRAGFMGRTSKTQTVFPIPPKLDPIEGKTIDEIEESKRKQQAQLICFYEVSLQSFTEHVLGLQLSPMRGKGFHGYKDSMTLRNDKGQECGFVGIGGQLDTVYFQISGTGCKYVFDHCSPFRLHHYLSKVLSVNHLARIDLAKDCFDNIYNCKYAHDCYIEDMFRTGSRGQSPSYGESHKFTYDKALNRQYTQEMVTIGSRTSALYWRVYNKKLEQGIQTDDKEFFWYRTEAELKKWTVDALLKVSEVFAGLNPFAQSMEETKGRVTKAMTNTKEACLELAGRVRHFRRMGGKALQDILMLTSGDISAAFGLLVKPDDEILGGKVSLPPTYQKLVSHVMEC